MDRVSVSDSLWDVNRLRSQCIIVSGPVYQGPDWGLRPRSPHGILIRGLAAYSRRSRACQSHTHLSFPFLSQTPSLSHTYARREHFSTAHTYAEEACLIAGCGLGSVFSFILILIGLCSLRGFLLQWGRTSPYNERGFFSHDIIFPQPTPFERFVRNNHVWSIKRVGCKNVA